MLEGKISTQEMLYMVTTIATAAIDIFTINNKIGTGFFCTLSSFDFSFILISL